MRDSITERSQQSTVLRVVVGVMAEILAELGDLFPLWVVNYQAIAGGSGIAPGAAVDMRRVGMGDVH